jgi:hypothetical protein
MTQDTLQLACAVYEKSGRWVEVIDIFGNDTMTLVPLNVG